jgi:hypothetical protein
MPALNPETNTKACSTCKEEQPASEYWKNTASFDSLDYQCKTCKRASRPHQDKTNAKVYARNWNRFKHTGFTIQEFDSKLEEQNFQCAICLTTEPGGRDWNADHDHSDGQKRGVLCRKCNLGIGHLNDDPEVLQRAIEYINYYNSLKGK